MGDDGTFRFELSIELSPEGAGTRLTQVLGVRPRWFIAPVNAILWPLLMRKRAQAAMDDTLANAKRVVEAERA